MVTHDQAEAMTLADRIVVFHDRCIQQVADQTLSRADQRRAAGFFRNAQAAQDVRMSKRAADNQFWDRYKIFAATAERYCTR